MAFLTGVPGTSRQVPPHLARASSSLLILRVLSRTFGAMRERESWKNMRRRCCGAEGTPRPDWRKIHHQDFHLQKGGREEGCVGTDNSPSTEWMCGLCLLYHAFLSLLERVRERGRGRLLWNICICTYIKWAWWWIHPNAFPTFGFP